MTMAASITRWTPGRKLELVDALERGELTFADACARHDLSAEELAGWIKGARKHGQAGVSVGGIPTVRGTAKPQPETQS